MSAYQLRYLDKIPDHAVVNEAVELAKLGENRQWSHACFFA
ncbi:rRNA-specific 5-methylcytidine transferase [Streptococcus pneumoniae]|nr:rRNA-specific 5-methylcytidine transferase [Streptococcus pneumoniae]